MIRFTIATVCYQAEQTIERTLRSVADQDYAAIEHLIIDGASTDATLALVKKYLPNNQKGIAAHEGGISSPHLRLISEPDKGLYDAMNKALRWAQGDYILFLNAGDTFHRNDTLSSIAAQLDKQKLPAILYGDTDLVDTMGVFLRHRRLSPPERLTWKDFRAGMLVCHQSFFVRCDLARTQPYDLRYRFSADYDWCIRLLRQAEQQNLPLHNTHLIVSNYLAEGMTTRHHRASLLERLRIMAAHYGWPRAIAQHLWFVVRAFWKK